MTVTELTAAGSRDWSAVALSGSLILAAANGDYLYVSTDGGGTFQEVMTADAPPGAWAGVAVTVSGGITFQFAAVQNGDVLCTANNWGSIFTWFALGVRNWTSIAAASTGAVGKEGPCAGGAAGRAAHLAVSRAPTRASCMPLLPRATRCSSRSEALCLLCHHLLLLLQGTRASRWQRLLAVGGSSLPSSTSTRMERWQ